MRLLFLAGSPRRRSRSRLLLDHAFDQAQRLPLSPALDRIDLAVEAADPFRGWGVDYSLATHDLVGRLEAADAILIASPVFNGGTSSALKNLFEHVPYKSLRGKRAGLMLAAGGQISFLQVRSQLEQLLYYFQVQTLPRAVFARASDLDEGIPEGIASRVDALLAALLASAGWPTAPVGTGQAEA